MPTMADYAPEMRLFDEAGQRLYVTADERRRFLDAALLGSPEDRVFCHLLHYTGCQPSEGLELSASRIDRDDAVIVFRTLKKRKVDPKGRLKKPHYRAVPVPDTLINECASLCRQSDIPL